MMDCLIKHKHHRDMNEKCAAGVEHDQLVSTVSGVVKLQSKLLITSLVITEYSISDLKLLGTDLFPLKFPLYNRIFTKPHRQ